MVTFTKIKLNKMKNKMKLFTVLFSILMLVSCKDKGNYSKIDYETTAAKSDVHKIVVKESLDGGTYTYLNVEENGNTYWMAIPNTQVKVGDTYYYDGGMLMKDFESKQLEKTFDVITFAEGIRTTEKTAESNQANPHENVNANPAFNVDVKIEKPENGTSLGELLSDKKSFSGKSIIVKGQVVKVNNGIMDKNWVHIVDGTKFENKGDLTITTSELVKVGDTVTFKGKVALDKEFGKGYIYPIILEEGELIK